MFRLIEPGVSKSKQTINLCFSDFLEQSVFFWITIAIIAFNLIVHKYYAFISTYKMAPSSPKMVKDSHMVWVDCEMTGLDTSKDHLLEIAVIITDKDLNILAEGPDLVIHQTDEVCNSEAKPVQFSKWPDSAHCRHMHLYPIFEVTWQCTLPPHASISKFFFDFVSEIELR